MQGPVSFIPGMQGRSTFENHLNYHTIEEKPHDHINEAENNLIKFNTHSI